MDYGRIGMWVLNNCDQNVNLLKNVGKILRVYQDLGIF
jgi:hypothetical protein